MVFVGLDNILRVFKDPIVWKALGHNLIISASLVIGLTVISLGLALSLEKVHKRLKTITSTILFIPTIIPMVVVALIFQLQFDPDFGQVNSFLKRIGLAPLALNWLGDITPLLGIVPLALVTIILIIAWKAYGMRMVVYHAALKTLPQDVYDAARVDGASGWKLFWHITWPLLWPITSMLMVLTIIVMMQVFDIVFILTGGGPLHATETLGTYIFNQAFSVTNEFRNYGYSVAISLVLFLFIASLTLFNFLVLKRRHA